MDDVTRVFEQHRPMLLGLAYRLLGSMWDAEDAVQDAYLRWAGTRAEEVREPRAFLITVVSRLALDRLKAARVTREAYTGPWLPEPVDTRQLGPLDTVQLRDSVSFATMLVLERLTPPERAVFVLREAFDVPYADVSAVVGLPEGNCRQLLLRARRKIADGAGRGRPTPQQHAQLLQGFLNAARTGDLDALTGMLTADVVAWNDGGGRVRAALRPVLGRPNVVAFVSALVRRYDMGEARLVDVNGHPALRTTVAGQEQLVALRISEGRIAEIFAVLNPDKLRLVPSAAS